MSRKAARVDNEDAEYYAKPGQRHATPSPGDGARVFYESLFKENPKSMIALIWLIEHGVFSAEEATRRIADYQKAKETFRKQQAKVGSAKATTAARGSKSRARGGAGSGGAAKVVDEPDAGLRVGGDEGVGRVAV